MRKKLLYTLLVSCLFACSDKDTSYEVVKNDLRAPAYPLVTIDPYASAWSMSDNLYDSPVRHWTGKDFPLIGVVKVDGVSYRFMGTEELEMNAIVPTSQQGDWTAGIPQRSLRAIGPLRVTTIPNGSQTVVPLVPRKMSLRQKPSGEPVISGCAVW